MQPLRLKNLIFPSLTLSSILFAAAPLSFFFGNHEEYQAAFSEIAPYLAMNVGIASAACLVLFWLSRFFPRIQHVLVGAVIASAYAAWLQSQVLVWDFGPLDGGGIQWDQWSRHALAESAIWILILTAGTWAAIRFRRFVSTASRAIIVLGLLSVTASYLTSGYTPKPKRQDGYADLFKFHPENNTILILLDCFQLDFFTEIDRRYPEDLKFLEGFSFYRNHLTGYPTTYANIPLMLTGRFYQNQEPIRDFIKRAYAENSVIEKFAESGYVSDVASMNDLMVDGLDVGSGIRESTYRIVEKSGESLRMPAMLVTDGGLFRAVPTFLKNRIYGDGDWFISAMLKEPDTPPGWHGTDVKLLRLFERESNLRSPGKGTFKYLHFATPHPPYRVNKNLEHVSEGEDTRAKVIAQARGGLTIARRLLARLRNLEIYDSSEIIIVSDHGTRTHPVEFKNDEIDSATPAGDIPWYVRTAGPALFLYKPKGAGGPLTTSDMPTHMSDIHCILTRPLVDSGECRRIAMEMENPDRVRPFYNYHWTKEYGDWSKDYLPPIQKFEVVGHSLDPLSWRKKNIRLEAGWSNKIELGAVVPLSSDQSAGAYLGSGWSQAEPGHRWTDGSKAELSFILPRASDRDLLFRLDASGFAIAGIVDFQKIRVLANGIEVGAWQLQERKWHAVRIPAEVIKDDRLDIEFLISDPVAPCDIGASADCRELGIMARQLKLTFAPERDA